MVVGIVGAHLGGDDGEHGVVGTHDATAASEGEVGARQDDAGVYHTAGDVRPSLVQHLQGDHATVDHHHVPNLRFPPSMLTRQMSKPHTCGLPSVMLAYGLLPAKLARADLPLLPTRRVFRSTKGLATRLEHFKGVHCKPSFVDTAVVLKDRKLFLFLMQACHVAKEGMSW